MKKIGLLLVLVISTFTLTGCNFIKNDQAKDPKAPASLKKIVGNIEKATLDDDGNIIIKKSKITEKVVYISYEYEGVTIGLLAVKDSKGYVKVVVNTCQSCGGSPYAYFVQVGNKIQCQNCGSMFSIDDLDNLTDDGCNPINIEDKKEKDGNIVIETTQLKKLKDKFENWKGPKV